MVFDGFLTVFCDDEAGNQRCRRLGKWECISCPPGVIHGYVNDSLEPVYFQVMLGRGQPETMGYANDDLYKRRAAHLTGGGPSRAGMLLLFARGPQLPGDRKGVG